MQSNQIKPDLEFQDTSSILKKLSDLQRCPLLLTIMKISLLFYVEKGQILIIF